MRSAFILKKMDTQKEKEFLELKSKLLNEIEYREGVFRQLTFDSNREKGFVSNFLRGFLKHEEKAPNRLFKDNETYCRFLIDADKDLHRDIALAFEKSIEKLKRDYNDSILEADA
jgi:hypothetical protein